MTPSSAQTALAGTLLSTTPSPESILARLDEIQRDLLARSAHLRQPNFKAIHICDLESLFNAYDAAFLDGRCRAALDDRKLTFRLAPRLTKAAGKTTQYRYPNGDVRFEIAIATSMLFDGFKDTDRGVTVCGRKCGTRLDGLQRVFEHELVHLAELLSWGRTDCTAARFQGIAGRLLLHRAHTHELITRRERAAEAGIHPGSRVAFEFEGRRLMGIVNRITTRATILVEHPYGVRYSNGQRYLKYYVPIRSLQPVAAPPATPPPPSATSTRPKVGRNEPCPCGSGKNYRKCCGE